ncbi:MAG: heparinase II/III family protein [Rhodobacteraceae bacterium]|nr:heparinase II/III family protein [Paracoccaceae bacterium]
MNRVQARLSALSRPAKAFESQPEPRTIGMMARGRQLKAGNFQFAGELVEAPDTSIWDIESPSPSFTADLHGFAWLDDLAAFGDTAACKLAQDWTFEWIERFGSGKGDGWSPDMTGRRLIRWINHAVLLLNGRTPKESRAYFRVLGRQTRFLARRWPASAHGLPRFEALTGLIYAGLALEGMARHVDKAIEALGKECSDRIDAEGGIRTRNPEELLEVLTLLTWATSALSEAGRKAPSDILDAIERIAPTLRALRHTDGGLARFHGGGRGQEGWLEMALASAGVRSGTPERLAMGFARIASGRTSLIMDAAPPPSGAASYEAHASTLAFELTSGRRPVIVNCGSGASFGEDWRRAGRATPSHSTLGLEGYSSSRFSAKGHVQGLARESLEDVPRDVRVERGTGEEGPFVIAGHDGYVVTHGLTHVRRLEMSLDGRGISGEDTLAAIKDLHRRQLDEALSMAKLKGVVFTIRFHMHPDVKASLDLGGSAVSMTLRSGEVWVFRHDSAARMTLEPSVYLEKGRLKPRATKQVVLSGAAMDYATRVRWSLTKAQETPNFVRDLEPAEELAAFN